MPQYKKTNLLQVEQDIFLKDESSRFSLNSFKILGVSYAMFRYFKDIFPVDVYDYQSLLRLVRNKNISMYTASDGNFGIAVSYMCFLLGIQCTIFLPNDVPQYYYKHIEKYNARIVTDFGNYDICVSKAIVAAKKENGFIFLDTQTDEYNSTICYKWLCYNVYGNQRYEV